MATAVAIPEKPRPGDALRDALFMLLTFGLAMAAAWGLKTYVEQRSVTYAAADGSLRLAYPAGWVAARATEATLLDVADARSGVFPPRFSVHAEAAAQGAGLREAAGVLALRRSSALREYRELSSHEITVSGQRAVEVTYAYVADPPAGPGQAMLPIVVQASDVLLSGNSRLYIFSAASEASEAATYAPVFARILASVQVRSTP